jgi:hypothetical protein
MYLPLTGYKEKDGISDKMKIPPVGAAMAHNAVRPTQKAVSPQENTQNVTAPNNSKNAPTSTSSTKSEGPNAVEMHHSHSMSTESFMVLRTQSQNEPFKILDEVIAKMKENMEEAGDALEALVEMIKKTSESTIALQLLEKTLEAMDEMNGKKE